MKYNIVLADLNDIPDTHGIYKIMNNANAKLYIGSALNMRKRAKLHFYSLDRGNHHNDYLQKAYNKYGRYAFEYSVIEIVRCPKLLIEREQYWLDTTMSYEPGNGYNICKIAGSTLGFKHSRESKLLMSQFGKQRTYSDETRAKISASHKGENNYMYGKKHSDATKKLMSEAHKGDRNYMYGKTHPLETKRRLSKIVKARWQDKLLEMNRNSGQLYLFDM